MFLDMITRGGETALKRKNPRIFVSSIFEIKEGNELPNTKAELIDLLNKKVVIPFHKMVCSQCHAIPKAKEWLTDPISGNLFFFLKVFKSAAHKYLDFNHKNMAIRFG